VLELSGLRGGEEMLDAQLNAFREKKAYQSALRSPCRRITSRDL
jgi:hypothetical protein